MLFLAGASIGAICNYGTSGFKKDIDDFLENSDEMFMETAHEQELEDIIGREIFLNWLDWKEQREARVAVLEKNYLETEENWDYFAELFANVRAIFIEDYLPEEALIGQATEDGNLYLFCPENPEDCADDQVIVHELTHLWHFSLTAEQQNEFERRWREIARSDYHGNFVGSVEFCPVLIRRLAAVTCYGATNIYEDVAETAGLVYALNHSRIFAVGFPNRNIDFEQIEKFYFNEIIPSTVSRIKQKIELLQEFGAFSEKEKNLALEELRDFSFFNECFFQGNHGELDGN